VRKRWKPDATHAGRALHLRRAMILLALKAYSGVCLAHSGIYGGIGGAGRTGLLALRILPKRPVCG